MNLTLQVENQYVLMIDLLYLLLFLKVKIVLINLSHGYQIKKWTQKITKQCFNKRLIMTSQEEEIYNNSQICWICKQELNMDKVRDHCHVTGRFRGAAHNKCNINLRFPR